MGYWNYRIVRYRDGSGHGLHEVYYDEDGTPRLMTERPAAFVVYDDEDAAGIVAALERALNDAKERPIIDEIVPYTTT